MLKFCKKRERLAYASVGMINNAAGRAGTTACTTTAAVAEKLKLLEDDLHPAAFFLRRLVFPLVEPKPAFDVAVRNRAGMIWSVSMFEDGMTSVRERICLTAGIRLLGCEFAWIGDAAANRGGGGGLGAG